MILLRVKENIFLICVSLLNLLFILSGIVICILGYDIKYPTLVHNLGAYVAWFLIITPTISALFISKSLKTSALKAKKHPVLRTVLKTSLKIMPSIMISIIIGFIMVFAFPALSSHTNNPKNYLIIGQDLKKYTTSLMHLFPEKIPANAKDVSYDYKSYSAIFSTDAVVSAAWSLPPEEYFKFKEEKLSNPMYNKLQNSTYEVKFPSNPSDFNAARLKLLFEYNDETYTVKHIATFEGRY